MTYGVSLGCRHGDRGNLQRAGAMGRRSHQPRVTGVLADNPRRLSKPLTNELLGLRTARRGDYRVLFTLDLEEHTLYVHRIEHRADVYKPR
jgi:mRNA-degrading endonuclease RelE of RelBE toxin-antitoxin system